MIRSDILAFWKFREQVGSRLGEELPRECQRKLRLRLASELGRGPVAFAIMLGRVWQFWHQGIGSRIVELKILKVRIYSI